MINMIRLFLDDVRDVEMIYSQFSNKDFVIVRSYSEFVNYILESGVPDFISFDNDLGETSEGVLLPSGYDAVKWLVYENSSIWLIDLNTMKETQIIGD